MSLELMAMLLTAGVRAKRPERAMLLIFMAVQSSLFLCSSDRDWPAVLFLVGLISLGRTRFVTDHFRYRRLKGQTKKTIKGIYK